MNHKITLNTVVSVADDNKYPAFIIDNHDEAMLDQHLAASYAIPLAQVRAKVENLYDAYHARKEILREKHGIELEDINLGYKLSPGETKMLEVELKKSEPKFSLEDGDMPWAFTAEGVEIIAHTAALTRYNFREDMKKNKLQFFGPTQMYRCCDEMSEEEEHRLSCLDRWVRQLETRGEDYYSLYIDNKEIPFPSELSF